ncbi:DUF6039 family protein [Saccharothrix yanglingensis]|uniref:Uncharacterized protein n=1 Tax=Saccharothrix yanglingensis TaxID=659496 RepID=A0ABU0WUX3_9PSEU|nr:DUF6039 family protein [Saccharothrix yanglingensis]MDQ2583626.1 hypothetical protein [Saccharothrix yanglingensis]
MTAWTFVPPAQEQTPDPVDELLHTGNSGLIIHRVGQVNYRFRRQARSFARDLQDGTNKALHPYATTLVYEELFGVQDRLHWLIHMKAPNDYGRLLEMVDHDAEYQEIAEADRLSEDGGGNWERMFAEGSFREHIIVPQHGLTHADDHDVEGLFAAPAQFQTDQSRDVMLHSGNAGVVLHRTGQVRYALRKQGRKFAFEWGAHLNRELAGRCTVFLYEEQWGTQDRIHWMIHLRTLDDYRAVLEQETGNDELRALLAKQRVPDHAGGGDWGALFLDGSLHDTVLIPHYPGAAGS